MIRTHNRTGHTKNKTSTHSHEHERTNTPKHKTADAVFSFITDAKRTKNIKIKKHIHAQTSKHKHTNAYTSPPHETTDKIRLPDTWLTTRPDRGGFLGTPGSQGPASPAPPRSQAGENS